MGTDAGMDARMSARKDAHEWLRLLGTQSRVLPSILSADFAALAASFKPLEDAGAEILHLDNPLRLDLKVPRIVIANDPPVPEAGSYLGIPALSGGRLHGADG